MISTRSSGSFANTKKFLSYISKDNLYADLQKYGRDGVAALASATPVDSGVTAQSWDYVIEKGSETTTIAWVNHNTNNGAQIAILIQYDHGTGTGGFVLGRDYINPAIQPIFDEMTSEIWERVRNA